MIKFIYICYTVYANELWMMFPGISFGFTFFFKGRTSGKTKKSHQNYSIEEFKKYNFILHSPEGLHTLLCITLLYSSVTSGIVSSLPCL